MESTYIYIHMYTENMMFILFLALLGKTAG